MSGWSNYLCTDENKKVAAFGKVKSVQCSHRRELSMTFFIYHTTREINVFITEKNFIKWPLDIDTIEGSKDRSCVSLWDELSVIPDVKNDSKSAWTHMFIQLSPPHERSRRKHPVFHVAPCLSFNVAQLSFTSKSQDMHISESVKTLQITLLQEPPVKPPCLTNQLAQNNTQIKAKIFFLRVKQKKKHVVILQTFPRP